MEKKKKGVMQSIPGWAWVLISIAAAILLAMRWQRQTGVGFCVEKR